MTRVIRVARSGADVVTVPEAMDQEDVSRLFATNRYIVWAKPIRVTFPDGHTFKPLG